MVVTAVSIPLSHLEPPCATGVQLKKSHSAQLKGLGARTQQAQSYAAQFWKLSWSSSTPPSHRKVLPALGSQRSPLFLTCPCTQLLWLGSTGLSQPSFYGQRMQDCSKYGSDSGGIILVPHLSRYMGLMPI